MKTLQKIAIHGAPRSGTTWLGELLNSSQTTVYKFQPLFSYALKDALSDSSGQQEINRFFVKLLSTSDSFLDQTEARESGKLPRFEKGSPTHLIYKEVRYHHILENLLEKTDDVSLVLLIRNPLSVISSWLLAPREFRKDLGWVAGEEWRQAKKKNLNRREEFNGYEKWKEATTLFLRLKEDFPDRVLLVEYQNLVHQLPETLDCLFSFCGLDIGAQTKKFVQSSSSASHADAYSVFRQKTNDQQWKAHLPPEIAQQIIRDLKNTQLEKYLYDAVDLLNDPTVSMTAACSA